MGPKINRLNSDAWSLDAFSFPNFPHVISISFPYALGGAAAVGGTNFQVGVPLVVPPSLSSDLLCPETLPEPEAALTL